MIGRAPRGSFLPPPIRYGGSGTSSGGYNGVGGSGARNSAGGTGNDASPSTGMRLVDKIKKQWSFDQQGFAGEPGGGA